MFEEKDKLNKNKENLDLNKDKRFYFEQKEVKPLFLYGKKIAIVFIIALLAVGILYFTSYFIFKNKNKAPVTNIPQEEEKKVDENLTGILPGDLSSATSTNYDKDRFFGDVKAEFLTFGDFYKAKKDNFQPQIRKLILPVNVKEEVSNYYDISRKINIDQQINKLNTDGFAILNNSFIEEANNFFSIYKVLINRDIPLVITSDFLIYYYQNILKQVFKDIEKDVFYQNLWQINKKLFDIADARYKQRLNLIGMTNDLILEGERLEAAYFATALELLKPTSEQINKQTNFIDEAKFTQQESEFYDFSLPDYLKVDVVKEVELIRQARRKTKSPVFLYQKDYEYFLVPFVYSENAKLYNFYLATRWLNSLFPLYEKGDSCLNCLLSKDDWRINMIAANFIAKDFSDNQELKNEWAIIYKVISYFFGLRSDLTYLHYNDAVVDIFGPKYKIEDIFSKENPERENNFTKFQLRVAQFVFSEAEGGINRNNSSTKSLLGMRMLQETYWPNSYIFEQLTDPNVTDYVGSFKTNNNQNNITFCGYDDNKIIRRCRGFGLDIVNLIYPLAKENEYFKENTNYNNYENQIKILRRQISRFNINSWHNNNFWTTLSIAKSTLQASNLVDPTFINNKNWQERNINLVLSAWVNLQLGVEKFANPSYSKRMENKLSVSDDYNIYNNIELNLPLIQELICNTNMMLEILEALKVTEKSPAATASLKDLRANLYTIENLIKKRLENKNLDNNDNRFISDLVKQFEVNKDISKNLRLVFKNRENLIESIDGVKLLILVTKYYDKLIFVVGPVFNYQEKIGIP